MTVRLASVAPSSAITLDPASPPAGGVYDGSPLITLTVTDVSSGVAKTEHQVDGGAWQTYAAPFRVGPGPHTIGYRSTDLAGDVETAKARAPFNAGASEDGTVGGSVPATLSLTFGVPATFGAFTPGVAAEYTATASATVISTAGDAALTVSDPGQLMSGAYALSQPLRVELAPASWTGPVANAGVAITFKQAIGANDALRTGTYSKTVAFTLSTTNP